MTKVNFIHHLIIIINFMKLINKIKIEKVFTKRNKRKINSSILSFLRFNFKNLNLQSFSFLVVYTFHFFQISIFLEFNERFNNFYHIKNTY